MHIVIKNAAPTDSRLKKWGDYHFGRSLTKYLEREGHSVETHFDGQWQKQVQTDVVLVLRGKYRYLPSDRSALHILWVISHPDEVSDEELASYDLAYVASSEAAVAWQSRTQSPVRPLLQCTDCEEFVAGGDRMRRQVIFVGNTRGQERKIVLDAFRLGLQPAIWGRGWEQFPKVNTVQADYIDNEALGKLYGQSRLTLNDHWPDMQRHGFVNNRIFDALACGLPVLSDANPGLDSLHLPGVMTAADDEQLRRAINRYLFCYPSLSSAAASARVRVEQEFSFAARATTILADIHAMRA